jgi:beta-galactosidase
MSKNTFKFSRREFLQMAASAAVVSFSGGTRSAETSRQDPLPLGRDQPFDLNWRFLRGAGEGLEAADYGDSGWRNIDLPHDWSIEDIPGDTVPGRMGPFDRTSEGGPDTGFTVGGEGWYRKRFQLPELPASGHVEVLFDGVSVLSDLWVNGLPVGNHVHAYTPFAFDLTPYIRRGAENVIAMRVRNTGRNSRWYAGSGIYRSVTITVLPESARIARWGIQAWTRKITGKTAEIDVNTRLEQVGEGLSLATRLRDPAGRIVAEAASPAMREVKQTLLLDAPNLWSPAHPHLYTLESVLKRDEQIIDAVRQTFGVRIVTIDAEHGLRINGENLKLKGGCVHHDNGLLGAAAFADAEERRVLRLKARGFNAIRSSHNPSSRAFRDACDRHGMLLIEESFDMWHAAKLPDDYSVHFRDHWKKDIQAMVFSSRNHPSVIMWSIGNEIPKRSTPEGVEWCWYLANEVHRHDPTRPVTAAINGSPGRPIIAAAGTARPGHDGQADYASSIFLDVVGYNYKLGDFERDHAVNPERTFYGSETYPREAYDYRELMQRAPYMLGEFVWTAMDYLGEAGIGLTRRVPADNARMVPHEFPVVGAFCGDIDLIGEQKPQSLARDVVWGLSPLEMTVARPLDDNQIELVPLWGWPEELPSWTWPGADGRTLKVRVYTSGDEVEFRLNKQLVAKKSLTAGDKMRAEIQVPYTPGELLAIAFMNGTEIGRRVLKTATSASRIHLTSESDVGGFDRQSHHFVRLDVLDSGGRVVPTATEEVRLTVEGPGELIGFGSANPRATGSFQSNETLTYQGQALAILRGTGKRGTVRVLARCKGLESGETLLTLE